MMASAAPAGSDTSRQLLRQLSHQHSDSGGDSVAEELELLENVYFDEMNIAHLESGEVLLSFHITPSTADNKEKQFVYLDLSVVLTVQYPHASPALEVTQSRGLSDAHLRGISEGLQYKSLECLGSPMVYELVEYAKDCLTDNNKPCGECAICQFEFEESDEFTKTSCYHYFHLPCLARYLTFEEHRLREAAENEAGTDLMLRQKPKELECPVCREPISSSDACLEAVKAVSPNEDTTDTSGFVPSETLKEWQIQMTALLHQQHSRGGTITVVADDVIDETWVSTSRSHAPNKAEVVDSLHSSSTSKQSPLSKQRVEDCAQEKKMKSSQTEPRHREARGGQTVGQRVSRPNVYRDSGVEQRRVTGDTCSERYTHESCGGDMKTTRMDDDVTVHVKSADAVEKPLQYTGAVDHLSHSKHEKYRPPRRDRPRPTKHGGSQPVRAQPLNQDERQRPRQRDQPLKQRQPPQQVRDQPLKEHKLPQQEGDGQHQPPQHETDRPLKQRHLQKRERDLPSRQHQPPQERDRPPKQHQPPQESDRLPKQHQPPQEWAQLPTERPPRWERAKPPEGSECGGEGYRDESYRPRGKEYRHKRYHDTGRYSEHHPSCYTGKSKASQCKSGERITQLSRGEDDSTTSVRLQTHRGFSDRARGDSAREEVMQSYGSKPPRHRGRHEGEGKPPKGDGSCS